PPESGWPALNTVLSERWFGQARFTQRLERGFVLQHEGRSAAPSARSGGLDDIQMRRIEQVRVRSLLQGGRRAALVALIPLANIGQHGRLVDMTALRL